MKSPVAFAAPSLAFALAVIAVVAGCDGGALAPPPGRAPSDPYAAGDAGDGDGSTADAAPAFDDGTPTRVACKSALGSGLSPEHGRLDGQLVSIVGTSDRGCPSDAQHLHLQVLMKGAIYDIAVNLDGLEGETDAPLPGIPFAEGWHPMGLDYVSDLGLHSSAISLTSPAAIRQRVEAALTAANHVSVFGYGYPGSDGAHIVHYNGGARDGAIVVNPSAPRAHVIAFRFADDTF